MTHGDGSAGVPRVARWLLGVTLPEDVHEHIPDELEEVFAERCAAVGLRRARAWYWRETLSFSVRFLGERLRGERRMAASVERRDGMNMRSDGPKSGISWLDIKLGFRMLVKYPVLSLVGGLAVTVAAGIGVGASEFVRDLISPKLPLEDGDRVVRIANAGAPTTFYDFVTWSEQLQSVTDVSAGLQREVGVVTATGQTGAVRVAQLTASAFRLTRVEPLLGRFLVDDDEREGAPPVVVLGYDSWQQLFGGDERALGQVVQLGGAAATVVGVMPESYTFPANHQAWTPLRFSRVEARPGVGPGLQVLARLADGVSLDEAKAELASVAARTAADFPDIYGQVRTEVDRYGAFGGGDIRVMAVFYGVRLLLIFLLLVACANVATLVFARTVTREGEIALRMSLGATRRRIVLQLFAEALVLVTGATLLGMFVARWALGSIGDLFWTVQQEPAAPFWWNDDLSLPTILYAGVLALVGSLMVGVVPALKATRAVSQRRLNELSAGGGAGIRFGGMWTAVIVFQVALSVAFLPLAVEQGATALENPFDESSFPATEYVTAQLGRDAVIPARTDAERAEFLEVSRQLFDEVKRRVQSDPSVIEVAFASGLSAMNHVQAPIEFVGDGSGPPISATARTLLVEPEYLSMMGATVVAGRTLQAADFADGSRAVVVNEEFVRQELLGGNAVGGLLRIPERSGEAGRVAVPEAGESLEIVGVVRDPGIDAFGPGVHPVVYAPLSLAPVTPRAVGLVGMPQAPAAQIFVHQRPGSEPLTTRLYDIVLAVDPSLRVSEVGTAEDAWRPVHQNAQLIGWVFMLVAGIVLMLSIAGIYALMSFTVSQRTRDIAIRVAVGASPAQVIRGVFTRAILQLALGVLVGSLIATPVLRGSLADGPRNVVIVGSLLLAAGLGSCVVPMRRALRIHPSHAMKTG